MGQGLQAANLDTLVNKTLEFHQHLFHIGSWWFLVLNNDPQKQEKIQFR